MGVVCVVVDKVGRDAHHDKGRDEVQSVVRHDERTMHFVGADGGRAVVGVCVGTASHRSYFCLLLL